ncbi:PadR family transcriptional regulator [Caulobacter segnis]|uniref:Transcriptional regulator, PadR-like family n=2 Tax=Caulobacter segnis TaxID=88688 RepID=D5VFL8_CAUST|nr:PadR family transcriptional regulator [Caulobacter segnis]ADG09750.1 transcriptional regulator, PadR-like family [Caulobacter segnis ATCC 21756]AVQ01523.1 PadR family transcriptional regulator [Caulobacter segnis]
MLTELEGAVLSEIRDRGRRTAFQVRGAFKSSPSVEWSGSAGSVYPAIKRLEGAGLIRSEPLPGGRRAMALRVTEAGEAALDAWARDPQRAAGVGLDPFRLRSGIWLTLEPQARRAAMRDVSEAIQASIAAHERDLAAADPIERPRMLLALRLQRLRLDWIEETLAQ